MRAPVTKLILLTTDGNHIEYPLGDDAVWIGRSRENALPIADRRASRRHCRVEPENDGYVVIDDGSANGTLVNGQLVQSRPLDTGDVIQIGATRIFFDRVDDTRTQILDVFDDGDDESRRERTDLLRLQRTARALNSELDRGRLFDLVLDHAIDIVRAERGFLLLKGSEGGLEFAASRNFAGDAVEGNELDISRSLASGVMESGEAICAVNAQEDERFRDVQSISMLGLRSVICVPLREHDQVVGALYLDNRLARRAFGPADQRMLEALADHAAIALRNARLFAEASSSRVELVEAQARVEALNGRLEQIVRGQSIELEELRGAFRARQTLETKYDYSEIIGRSAAVMETLRILDRVVDSDVPVHIHGESGTGKELIARAIHVHGRRNDCPFISENCAALTETLLESELFGYVRGAFTGAERDRKGLFELAHTGTLFLDEVGDMSQGMQRKLLRVLQEGEVRRVGAVEPIKVDVRIVSASNRDLHQMVADGEFRQDLYYRLRVLQIGMPPLRERREDVPLLVSHFLDREALRTGGKPVRLAPGVLESLTAYDWPGNVRELENECMRMVALSGEIVEPSVLSEQIRGHVPQSIPIGKPDVVRDLGQLVQNVEVAEIEKALTLFGNNKTKAADALCISRFALQRKLEKYGIEIGDS